MKLLTMVSIVDTSLVIKGTTVHILEFTHTHTHTHTHKHNVIVEIIDVASQCYLLTTQIIYG